VATADDSHKGKAEMNCPDNQKPPKYPSKSLENHEEGTVKLLFYIGADGYVLDSQVEKSSGFEALDKAALNVRDACVFKAADIDGNNLPFWVSAEYVWKLPG
jgi:protein TonB